MGEDGITRRDFVSRVAAPAVAAAVVPRRALGADPRSGRAAPSDTLNIAIIGAGGMGMSNAEELGSENIVALCDVDFGHVDRQLESRMRERDRDYPTERARAERIAKLDRLREAYGAARRYADFRRMLEREKDIDAVVVATPDHLHAVQTLAAMRLGKHVFVQKPLTWSVHESRVLLEEARRSPRVVTQMGNQGRSSDEARRVVEWVRAGLIGPVREVHMWTNRPIWPQGLPHPAGRGPVRPAATAAPASPAPPASPAAPSPPPNPYAHWNRRRVSEAHAAGMGGDVAVPPGLEWDLFLGPAREVPYHPVYHPFNWRGWVDWGVGALGDMAAHLLDPPWWALDLGYPSSIEATSTPWGGDPQDPASYPLATTVHYRFPERDGRPAVDATWYDGGLLPPRPHSLPYDLRLNPEGGVIFVGEKGLLIHENYGRNPRLLPEPLMEASVLVPQTLPRTGTTHEMNWVDACKGKAEPTSPFEVAAPLTEVMLLGLVALRAGQGRKVYYDPAAMKLTNAPDANVFLRREYRSGWGL